MSLMNKSTSLKDWHNAGMSSSWGSVLFGKMSGGAMCTKCDDTGVLGMFVYCICQKGKSRELEESNYNYNKGNECPTQKSKSKQ